MAAAGQRHWAGGVPVHRSAHATCPTPEDLQESLVSQRQVKKGCVCYGQGFSSPSWPWKLKGRRDSLVADHRAVPSAKWKGLICSQACKGQCLLWRRIPHWISLSWHCGLIQILVCSGRFISVANVGGGGGGELVKHYCWHNNDKYFAEEEQWMFAWCGLCELLQWSLPVWQYQVFAKSSSSGLPGHSLCRNFQTWHD